ncbi:hypothetical protein F5Y18DRAFT_379744 [Xylariaceae sp. FL1019]|nr:hypothetical protein F5Y18DRAFT_379744 [Xylariaceae sp. FL1019]
MPSKKKKSQTKLHFEPMSSPAASSPPGHASSFSPAKVRFSKASGQRQPRSSPSSSKQTPRRSQSKGQSQSRLENVISTPPASFMPSLHGSKQRTVAVDSSDESAAEAPGAGEDEEDDVEFLPTRKSVIAEQVVVQLDSDGSDHDEPILRNPRSSQSVSTKLRKAQLHEDEDGHEKDEDEEDEDEEDEPVVPTSSRKRQRRPTMVELDGSDSSDNEPVVPSSPVKRRRIIHKSSPIKRARHKGHRSEKEKKKELLQRRRAGEKIDRLTSSEPSSDDGERRGFYDSNSEDDFEALKEFDDEEEEEEVDEATVSRKAKKAKPKKDKQKASNDEDSDSFVTDDDDAPLGAPVDIPLEFTAQAHKPLKEQFPHVVEWLVHNKINPAFERKDAVYTNAWRKLNDEVQGLANSKFTSSAWRIDFARALRYRPKLEAYETRGTRTLPENCEACGRSGHPATWEIEFSGTPYHKDTLQEVESEDDDKSDANDGDSDGNASVDTQGMPLPRQGKRWNVGAVCSSNAETAHSLIHWKHALMEWVDQRLEDDGWGGAQKVTEREKMKPKRRRELANSIVDSWSERGVVAALYRDFKKTLEDARSKGTTGRTIRGRFR